MSSATALVLSLPLPLPLPLLIRTSRTMGQPRGRVPKLEIAI